jgi:RNA 2',3'-cyclic 3'-phosphodiesterase
MPVRLFAAVEIPAAERERLSAHVARCGLDQADIRLVDPALWHLTVAFFGDVDERKVEPLTERLTRAAARTAPLRIALSGAGTFPTRSDRARVLWVGLTGDTTGLARLAERCRAAGRRVGLDIAGSAYRPHLTLGRARHGQVDLRTEVSAVARFHGDTWRASSLVLVRSTLGTPVQHDVVQSFGFAS